MWCIRLGSLPRDSPRAHPEGKGKRLLRGGEQPRGIPLCAGSMAGAAALPSCGRVISRTLLLLQSLLLFFNWVERGNPASLFCTNKRDLLSRRPAL